MEAWANVNDVKDYTDFEASPAQVMRAQLMIEILSGATYGDNLHPQDLRKLRGAVAYQTPFIVEHPDLFTHVDVEDLSQDGVNARLSNDNAGLLAPMAHRCLRRLSWRGTRTRTVGQPRRRNAPSDDWNYDAQDPGWRPLGVRP
ncbi:hypothetical protein ACWFMI_23560 [Nocardiopsis terrae]|uniref:hypothetical protein n=1 Tax=Streptomyces sp. NPDC057554 TaxID=3350538 RepID=UPI0036D0B371